MRTRKRIHSNQESFTSTELSHHLQFHGDEGGHPIPYTGNHLNISSIANIMAVNYSQVPVSTKQLSNSAAVEQHSNPYLLLRESKIARNKERLVKLGLANSNNRSTKVRSNNPSNVVGKVSTAAVIPPRTRRSLRIRSSGGNDAQEKSGSLSLTSNGDDFENNSDGVISKLSSIKTEKIANKRCRDHSPSSQRPLLVTSSEPGFARTTAIDIHKVLFGFTLSAKDCDMEHNNLKCYRKGMIGRRFETPGKAIVVNFSARISEDIVDDSSSASNRTMLRFNKYSGICEWKNDVIFLWVNIGGPNSVVENTFLQGGRQITWFGGSKMHKNTPAIKNLLRVGKLVTSSSQECNFVIGSGKHGVDVGVSGGGGDVSGSGGIILWCRLYDSKKKTFLPYTCLGRVGYRSHNPDIHPIEFVWDLLDYEALMTVKVDDDKDSIDKLGMKNEFQHIMLQANK